eukprot:2796431-Prymnesium_polylepis.1
MSFLTARLHSIRRTWYETRRTSTTRRRSKTPTPARTHPPPPRGSADVLRQAKKWRPAAARALLRVAQ